VRHAEPILAIGFFSLVCLCLSNLNGFAPIVRFGVPGSKSGEKVVVYQNPVRDPEISAAAFKSILPILHHPRCMNCHSSGDFPRQGDDSHRHSMDIRRGPDGTGANTVKCSTCHQDHNLAGPHMPPGAPGWHLPSPGEPMIWEDLTDRQLCEVILDPKQNGNRSLTQIVEHMQTPLVLWGWNPGEGRAPVPMSSKQFQMQVELWISNGAACPPQQ
jgi:hypothetical protein